MKSGILYTFHLSTGVVLNAVFDECWGEEGLTLFCRRPSGEALEITL